MPRKGSESSRMRGHARRDSMFALLDQRRLTFPESSVNINPIRGDQEFMKEIQPHLNVGLWPIYLAECELRYVDPPVDGRQEAPGHAEPNPPISDE